VAYLNSVDQSIGSLLKRGGAIWREEREGACILDRMVKEQVFHIVRDWRRGKWQDGVSFDRGNQGFTVRERFTRDGKPASLGK
jgi:hypothetical protein